ncbi:hypothetical protein [Acetobacter sp. DsW_063]|uniref:hypothetical protein n=1 Tax=Acetobacter sp. DsW_063 TaxID=1514894 RepID=UPI001178C576|nr:hypothetical protein [Acetobacter sp. DsW_063]
MATLPYMTPTEIASKLRLPTGHFADDTKSAFTCAIFRPEQLALQPGSTSSRFQTERERDHILQRRQSEKCANFNDILIEINIKIFTVYIYVARKLFLYFSNLLENHFGWRTPRRSINRQQSKFCRQKNKNHSESLPSTDAASPSHLQTHHVATAMSDEKGVEHRRYTNAPLSMSDVVSLPFLCLAYEPVNNREEASRRPVAHTSPTRATQRQRHLSTTLSPTAALSLFQATANLVAYDTKYSYGKLAPPIFFQSNTEEI